jgi:hypothetical protein
MAEKKKITSIESFNRQLSKKIVGKNNKSLANKRV